MLDFIRRQNTFLEEGLEKATLRELEAFILELGEGLNELEKNKDTRYFNLGETKDRAKEIVVANRKRIT